MSLPRLARRLRLAAPILVAAACVLAGEAPAGAQGKTTTTLIQRAGTLFEDQQYEESIQTLSAALLRPGSSEAEKIETYRLLAYNYIILERTEEADAAVRVQLAYRTGSTGKFVTVTGTYSLGQFRTQIPGLAVKPPLIEYYLQAVDKSGLPLTSRGDAAAPLRVVVPGGGGVLTSPFFWVPVGAAVVGGAVLAA